MNSDQLKVELNLKPCVSLEILRAYENFILSHSSQDNKSFNLTTLECGAHSDGQESHYFEQLNFDTWFMEATESTYEKLISNKNDYYFVHLYYFDCANKDNILAETKYGTNFASIVGKENIYGVQFHPEKSSSQGLNLLKEFMRV